MTKLITTDDFYGLTLRKWELKDLIIGLKSIGMIKDDAVYDALLTLASVNDVEAVEHALLKVNLKLYRHGILYCVDCKLPAHDEPVPTAPTNGCVTIW